MSKILESKKRRFGTDGYECEYGFCMWNIVETDKAKELFIEDFDVYPETSDAMSGDILWDKITTAAKKNECKFIKEALDVRRVNFDNRVKELYQRGFKAFGMNQPTLLMFKEI